MSSVYVSVDNAALFVTEDKIDRRNLFVTNYPVIAYSPKGFTKEEIIIETMHLVPNIK